MIYKLVKLIYIVFLLVEINTSKKFKEHRLIVIKSYTDTVFLEAFMREI